MQGKLEGEFSKLLKVIEGYIPALLYQWWIKKKNTKVILSSEIMIVK